MPFHAQRKQVSSISAQKNIVKIVKVLIVLNFKVQYILRGTIMYQVVSDCRRFYEWFSDNAFALREHYDTISPYYGLYFGLDLYRYSSVLKAHPFRSSAFLPILKTRAFDRFCIPPQRKVDPASFVIRCGVDE